MIRKSDNVTFKLVGGLGNQLFIWATAYSYARRTNRPVSLDASECTMWGEQLHGFGIPVDVPGPKYPDGLLPSRYKSHDNFLLNSLRYFRGEFRKIQLGSTFWENTQLGYDPSVFEGHRKKIVRGYFQSHKYFDIHETEIRGHLTNIKTLSSDFYRLESKLPQVFTAVNLRLAKDYSDAKSKFGIVGLGYITKALEIVDSSFPNRPKIVFTDDVGMARKLIPGAEMYVGSGDLNSPAEKIFLMSKCNSFIGSNSSFSWWAAYLIQDRSVMKIFPKPWFQDVKLNSNEIMPDGWLQIPINP